MSEENEYWQKMLKDMKNHYENELTRRKNENKLYIEIILHWFTKIQELNSNFNKNTLISLNNE